MQNNKVMAAQILCIASSLKAITNEPSGTEILSLV
jgi:hypothetical protein